MNGLVAGRSRIAWLAICVLSGLTAVSSASASPKLAVIPGVSIAGVRLDSTETTVKQRLGTPCDSSSSVDDITHLTLTTLKFCAKKTKKVLTTVTLTAGKVDGISTFDPKIGAGSGLGVGSKFSAAKKALRHFYKKSIPINYSSGYLYVNRVGSRHAFRLTIGSGQRVKMLEMSKILDES